LAFAFNLFTRRSAALGCISSSRIVASLLFIIFIAARVNREALTPVPTDIAQATMLGPTYAAAFNSTKIFGRKGL
jgi:hypothetical protein